MRGVAEQRYAALSPALDRIAIEEGLRAPARRPGETYGARA